MRTNIVLDDKLTHEAFSLTGLKTKRELVDLALHELVRAKRQSKNISLGDAFKSLHELKLNDNPFPEIVRQDRSNPFADEL